MQGARITLSVNSLRLKSSSIKVAAKKPILSHVEMVTTQKNNNVQQSAMEEKVHNINNVIVGQQALNASLRIQIKQLEENLELRQSIIQAKKSLVQLTGGKLAVLNSSSVIPSNTSLNTKQITNTVPKLPKSKQINNSAPFERSNNSVWITTIWLLLAILIALLGSLFTSKRKVVVFAKKLENKLQDMAYSQQRVESQAPSLKELSIPKNLSTPVQIKYLNSAADFYLRCNRYDLAKELVNEGLIQFSGNTQIVKTLNSIRKQIVSQLDVNLHDDIIEKLELIDTSDIKSSEKVSGEISDHELTLDEINNEWARLWKKKAS